jgi:hypothetical protein
MRTEQTTPNIIQAIFPSYQKQKAPRRPLSPSSCIILQGLAIGSCIGVASWRPEQLNRNGVFNSHSLVNYTSGLLRAYIPDSCSRLQEHLLTDLRNGVSDCRCLVICVTEIAFESCIVRSCSCSFQNICLRKARAARYECRQGSCICR